jgi:S-(hydroxymethyl)glutathione dehydrogenase/alcohol dehydrogenase
MTRKERAMRAAILSAPGTPLVVRDDVEIGSPGPNEVRVRLAATGVCHSDLSIVDGSLPLVPTPAVLGHEGAGVVTEVGSSVSSLSEGDHVILSWVTPCGTCRPCLHGQVNLCLTDLEHVMIPTPRLQAAGEPVYVAQLGTFAEEVMVNAAAAIKIDPEVPLEIASLLGCGVMTGVGAAINTAKVEPGSSVVVFGCGGVGLNVVQGARLAGASEIVAVDVRQDKLDAAKRFGATRGATPEELNDVTVELTGQVGFDYAFEVIGRPETIRNAWEATRRGGTTVVVGAGSPTAEVTFSALELFFMEKRLLGCVYGSADPRRDFPRLLGLWRAGKLDLDGLITQRIALDDINQAFDAMARGEGVRSLVTFD